MRNNISIARLIATVTQILSMILFIFPYIHQAAALLLVISTISIFIIIAFQPSIDIADTYAMIASILGLCVLIYYSIYGSKVATSALMVAAFATSFVIQILQSEQRDAATAPRPKREQREQRAEKIDDVFVLPSFERESKPYAEAEAEGDYSKMALKDEADKILKELDDIEVNIGQLSDGDEPAESKMLFVNKNGSSYHTIDCIALKNTKKNDLKLFTSVEEARKKGYKPCRICKP